MSTVLKWSGNHINISIIQRPAKASFAAARKREYTQQAIWQTNQKDNDGTLDKESTSYNDIFDAFRLALKFYQFTEKE